MVMASLTLKLVFHFFQMFHVAKPEGDVTIQLDDHVQSIHQLQLYDLSEKMVRNITSFSSDSIQLQRGHLPQGCYFVKIDLAIKIYSW